MSKLYAVKIGKIPGIYTTWYECEKNVKGFSGAVYKSFNEMKKAEEFMELNAIKDYYTLEKNLNTIFSLEIFSDGSHSKHEKNGYLGIGVFCSYMGNEYKLSKNCDYEMIKEYDIESNVLSNCTMEFLAFAETLKMLIGKKLKRYIFIFKIDYEGVQNWMNGNWKCKQIYIQKIKEKCDNYLSQIDAKIKIEHVPGHSNIYGNEQADKLAKSKKTIDTLSELFNNL